MKSLLSRLRMHWDHEPWKAPASRTHSKRFAKSQALGHCAAAFGVRGACSRFRTRFMERGTQRPRGCDRTSPSPQPFPRSCLAGRGSTRLQRWWVCQDAPVSICAHLPLLTERLCDSVPGRAAPEVLRNNPAIGTDEKSGGNAADTELVGEFGLRPFAKKALYPFQPAGPYEFLDLLGFGIEAQADDDEARIFAKGLIGFLHFRQFGHAWATPGRPEVQEHELATIVGEFQRFALE